jgi:hypothetical protein
VAGEDTKQPERDEAAEEKRFVEDLITRGEAAEADESGQLPPGATHEIVERRPGETPKVVRRRFSAF